MDSLTVKTHISAPREKVYELIADVAARPAWTDNYQKDFRLLTPRSVGRGAGARYRLDAPGGTRYIDFTIAEASGPRKLVEAGSTGRMGRTRYGAEYELAESGRTTRLELTIWTEPENAIERLREAIRFRGWLKRRARKSLDRLRRILEDGADQPLTRATIAGYEGRKAPRFGSRAGRDFAARDGDPPPSEARPRPGAVAE